MIIESLELKDYRNYESLNIKLSSGGNIFYGDNAQGKTNILESIYLATTSKSHRGSKDKDIIKFGSNESHIKLMIEKNSSSVRLDMHLKKSKSKGVAINGIPIRKLSELFGTCNVVFFSPEDLNIIKRSPKERRNFVDMELCQLNKLYVSTLVTYNKVLDQRNKLLKEIGFKSGVEDTLDIWDMQLVKYGKDLIAYREAFIKELNEVIYGIHSLLSGGEKINVVYEKNVEKDDFEEELKKSRTSDIRYKTTNVGPHRDDFSFFLNGEMDLKKFGSQGQQRSLALSLKLSEIELIKSRYGEFPVLLLDDVLSELDGKRQSHLLESIKHIQTLITCTGVEDFLNKSLDIGKVFKVTNGTIKESEYN